MKHNVVRAKAISAIFRLESFTVQELADASGLKADQLYPILKDCKDQGFLSTQASPNAERKPHRPILMYSLLPDAGSRAAIASELLPLIPTPPEEGNTYALTRDQDTRSGMADDLLPLLEVSPEEVQERSQRPVFVDALYRAGSLLDDVEIELGSLGETVGGPIAEERFTVAEQKMADAREDLEGATYESRIRISELAIGEPGIDSPEEPRHSLNVGWTRFRSYERRLADLKAEFTAAIADRAAQQEYGAAMSDLNLSDVNPGIFEHQLTELYGKAQNPILREIYSLTLENLKESQLATSDGLIKEPSWAAVQSLMTSTIRYCADASLPLAMGVFLADRLDDCCLTYNLANLHMLAGKGPSVAFGLWNRWATEFQQSGYLWHGETSRGRYRTPYSYLAMISIRLADLDTGMFSDLERRLGERGTFSVVCHSPLAMRGSKPYVAEATLCDHFSPVQEVRISESMANHIGKLYVYGSLEKRVKDVPGLPTVRLASSLVLSGVPTNKAWEIAQNLHKTDALIVLHSFDQQTGGAVHVQNATKGLQMRPGSLLLEPAFATKMATTAATARHS